MESHITFMMGFCVLTNARRARSLAPQPSTRLLFAEGRDAGEPESEKD